MTKKDYQKFAKLIHDELDELNNPHVLGIENNQNKEIYGMLKEVSVMATRIADIFAADNPHFDYTRFYSACGIESR